MVHPGVGPSLLELMIPPTDGLVVWGQHILLELRSPGFDPCAVWPYLFSSNTPLNHLFTSFGLLL